MARADLSSVGAGLMRVVRQLDAIHRFHFRKDAESLAASKSARKRGVAASGQVSFAGWAGSGEAGGVGVAR